MREFLRTELNMSIRAATRAAQKLPEDWEDKCEQSVMRKGWIVWEYEIPAQLHVNSDQTQIVYAPGTKLTWAETGAKQVSLIGGDEKRAFTVMVSVSNSGDLLPFQVIYMGKTTASMPSNMAPHYHDCINAGFRFEFSGTKTYWSNQKTMQDFVRHILVPYFEAKKQELGLPKSQKALWTIDVWSVHRSEEFREWMKAYYPWIILDYVPGGCTGVAQPCDVGIQQPFKHVVKQAYHEFIVRELTAQMTANQGDEDLAAILDTRVGVLRDASVSWLWNAWTALNRPDLVKKVREVTVTVQLLPTLSSVFVRRLKCVVYASGICLMPHLQDMLSKSGCGLFDTRTPSSGWNSRQRLQKSSAALHQMSPCLKIS
ncbi:hypothetical protein K474DRAFT_1607106 [Panus rudis PR-1116 ss-1]|nr:hypothetical protein K474DRAFT_1607106 [Panus rudis PR-1116 ss-1]